MSGMLAREWIGLFGAALQGERLWWVAKSGGGERLAKFDDASSFGSLMVADTSRCEYNYIINLRQISRSILRLSKRCILLWKYPGSVTPARIIPCPCFHPREVVSLRHRQLLIQGAAALSLHEHTTINQPSHPSVRRPVSQRLCVYIRI